MVASRAKQLLILLYKNWLFTIRNWISSVAQLLLPMLFILTVYLLGFLPSRLQNIPHPQSHPVMALPKCQGWNGQGCQTLEVLTAKITLSLASVPPISVEEFTDLEEIECVRKVLTLFANYEGLSLGINDSSADIFWDMAKNPEEYLLPNSTGRSNYTQAILMFLKCDLSEGDPSNARLNYDIIYNSSRTFSFSQIYFGSMNKPDGRKEIQVGIDRAFMTLALNKTVDLSVSTKNYPTVYKAASKEDREAGMVTLFVYCGIAFQFIFLLYNIVQEKDLKLRQGLKLIGLKDSMYWLSWTITGLIFGLSATLLLQAIGFATQLKFFTNTDFYITFVIFFVYSGCLVSLAFFFSVLISTARQAVIAGICFFVIGALFIMFIGNSFVIEQLYYNLRFVTFILSLLPPFPLAKAMSDIAAASRTTTTFGEERTPERFSTSDFITNKNTTILNLGAGEADFFDMPATVYSVVWLMGDAILFGILAWYLDAIFPGNHGIPRKWYFPFDPYYWWPYQRKQTPITPDESEVVTPVATENTPLLGSTKSTNSLSLSKAPLTVSNLQKSFRSLCAGQIKCAVNNLTLSAAQDQIFALLGHNGAGKSTTINMLTGLLQPTSGDAQLYGLSIKKDMDSIRNILGVCPQHNILWDDLTAREHMRMFAYLKGVPSLQRKQEITELLENVQLDDVADHKVSTYSGGMKRRLSVALAFVGNPKVVFLDEPTTGMDPKIRREIWNLILRMKEDRLIIMTTHSMEEADILGDCIAIMAEGQLRDMGSPVYLKNKYAGYTVELVVCPNHQEEIAEIVQTMLRGATLKNAPIEIEGGILYQYRLPPENRSEVSNFFRVIEGKKDKVSSCSISQTTLEEVFLLVTGGLTDLIYELM